MACSPGDNKAVSVVVKPVAGLTSGACAPTTGSPLSSSSGTSGSATVLSTGGFSKVLDCLSSRGGSNALSRSSNLLKFQKLFSFSKAPKGKKYCMLYLPVSKPGLFLSIFSHLDLSPSGP